MTKRIFDIAIVVMSLVFVLPLLIIVAVLVVKNLGSPVFFKQVRPGKNGQPFLMVKFRSMRNAFTKDGTLLPDEFRLTKFGRFLRASSLDELPELWNVLIGDMSLVGPRPLLMEYLPLYNPEQYRRHQVLPGITGWAQINGRNAISWQEKFELDVWYVENQSLLLDIKILLGTIKKVLRKDGVSAADHVTAERFTGNE